jgi:CxxC motif-containing protein (DUF1111 family)
VGVLPRVVVLALLLAGCGLIGLSTGPVVGQGFEPVPIEGVGPDEQARFAAGRGVFEQVHGVGDGLGPFFNARACAECHASPGPGGSNSTVNNQVVIFGRSDHAGGFDPLPHLGGPVRSQLSVRNELPGCGLRGEELPKEANVKAHRQPAPLYGLGLIEAIPDEVIVAQVEAGASADYGEVRGRPSIVDGRVGRFGWKAQAATLEQFIGRAMAEELGITNPVAPEESAAWRGGAAAGCDPLPDPEDDGARLAALVDFVALLAPPGRSGDPGAVAYGEAVFHQVGCAACHTPSLRTGPHPIAALSEREAPLYSDLLIHEMGEYLADETVQGGARSTDWRTTPLWGLGRKTLFLHDGRTADLREAIEAHSGEGRAARYRLRQRPKGDVEALVAFLKSL